MPAVGKLLSLPLSPLTNRRSGLDIFVTLTYDILAIKTKTVKETSRQNVLITESCRGLRGSIRTLLKSTPELRAEMS